MQRLAAFVLCCAALAAFWTWSGETAGEPPAEPEISRFSPVAWSELRFRARKALMKAETTIRVEETGYAQLAAELRDFPAERGEALKACSGQISKLVLETDLPFGRSEVAYAWVDQGSGEALQGEKQVGGSKRYWKLWRYSRGGILQWRAEPAEPSEKSLPMESWTKRKLETRVWQQDLPAGAVVTDSYALIYLLSAARLETSGAELVLLVPSREKLVEVRFQAVAKIQKEVRFEQVSSHGTVQREGTIPVWKLVGTGRYLGSAEVSKDVDTGFMGMRGGLTVLIEEGTGIPIEVSGKVKVLGRVTVRLAQVRMRD